MSNEKQYQNWPGLLEYTREFKEWIWKLFRKVHARIGHVEEDLANVRKKTIVDYQLLEDFVDGKYEYVLYDYNHPDEYHGKISIDVSNGIQIVNWYDGPYNNELQTAPFTKVYRWEGTRSEWETQILNNNKWQNCLVFGIVDSSTKCIFAGKLDYVYEIKDVQDSATVDDVLANTSVGYVTKGMTIPEGTTLQDLVNMIFTKVLGLKKDATAPKAEISGIDKETKEVGDIINSITVTAKYVDGCWNNEEDWKNSHSNNKTYQPYGTIAKTYAFSGMHTEPAQNSSTITFTNYIVKYGSQTETVTITNTSSSLIPVNQNGSALQSGQVNNTSTYKKYVASPVSSTSFTITGDYKYWIGYTTIKGNELTRSLIDSDMTVVKTGWAGNGVVYLNDPDAEPMEAPNGTYITFIVPSPMTLKTVADPQGIPVPLTKYTLTSKDISIGGNYTFNYNIYQEYVAADTLKRKKITLN